ncbi:MAG: MFS transporter [Lachnospiraceae bacterium]|nr:MFS transporter [Lachnospiraceae bacterium]
MRKRVSAKLLLAFMCVFYVGANMAHPFTPTLFKNLNLPDYMFGVALACMSVMGFLIGPFWGKSSDVIGRVKIMFIGCIGYSVGQFLFSIAYNIPTVVIARLFSGIFCNATIICSMAYMVDNIEVKSRSRFMSYMAALSAVFSATGYLLGGILADISIRLAFNIQCIILLTAGMLMWLFIQDNRHEDVNAFAKNYIYKYERGSDKNSLKDSIKKVLLMLKDNNPLSAIKSSKSILTSVMIVFLISVCLANFATICFDNAFNYYLKAEFNFPSTYNGIIKAVVGIIGLIANFTINIWLSRHTDIRKTIIFVFILASIAILIIMQQTQIRTFIIASLVFYLVNAIYLPMQQTLVTIDADADNAGMISGMFNSMRSIGQVTGSLMAGFAYGFGSRLPFIFAGIVFFMAAVTALVNYIQNQRQKQVQLELSR